MKNSKLTVMILALLTAALMLAGCTDRNVPTDNPAQPTAEISAAPVEKITTQPTSEPTAEPTAVPTAEPTAVPTAEPTEAPFPYNREEYDALLAFFELKDENGVTNGEKCFEDYNPSNVDFWGGESAQASGLPCFVWTEEGNLETLRFAADSETSVKLTGAFILDGFESLTELSAPAFHNKAAFVFDSVKITNCPKLDGAGTFEATGDVELNGYLWNSQLISATHCRFDGFDWRGTSNHSLLVDLTADGSGNVELLSHPEEHYYPVYIIATPDDGHSFIGWYDANGKLFSTENKLEISDETIGGCEGEFIYTARFE